MMFPLLLLQCRSMFSIKGPSELGSNVCCFPSSSFVLNSDEQGPAVQVQRSGRILQQLEAGCIEPLQKGRFFDAETGPKQTFGFCGHIHAYQPAETLRFTPEGMTV